MATNEYSVTIGRPAAQVFPHLVAGERRMRWMGALKESKQVTDGQPGKGTRFDDVFEEAGQRFEVEAEITDIRPPELLKLDLNGSAFESRVVHQLVENDGSTTLTTTITTEYLSALARLMSGVVTGHAQKQLEEDLERLKVQLETPSRPA
jgi:uncharacterized protein YndB with AHSA1/START domain